MYEPLATDLRPTTDAVLTIRVIKSFEFRTFKALILRGLDLETLTVGDLLERCKNGEENSFFRWRFNADGQELKTAAGFKAFRTLDVGGSCSGQANHRYPETVHGSTWPQGEHPWDRLTADNKSHHQPRPRRMDSGRPDQDSGQCWSE